MSSKAVKALNLKSAVGPPGETCAVVIGAVGYPLDKETKRKRVEHAVATAKAKAEGMEPPPPLSQLSDRDQYLQVMKDHGLGAVKQHTLTYFMDRE